MLAPYLRHDFYNIIFKIKHKLYIALGSASMCPWIKHWKHYTKHWSWKSWREVENTDTTLTGPLPPSYASVHETLFTCAPLTCEGNMAEKEGDHHDGANNDRIGLTST